MNVAKLQVLSDMLDDPERRKEALGKLHHWLARSPGGFLKSTKNILDVIGQTSNQTEDLDIKMMARLLAQLSGLIAHEDQKVAKRAARLVEVISPAVSRMVGNERLGKRRVLRRVKGSFRKRPLPNDSPASETAESILERFLPRAKRTRRRRSRVLSARPSKS